MNESPITVKVEKLRKEYEGLVALHSIDLAIPQGEIFGLIGPNGAGKTTPQSPLRICLGKLLGAPGDAYTALVASSPFLLLGIAFSRVSFPRFLIGYLLVLIVGVTLGILSFYIGTHLERSNRGDIGGLLIVPLILFVSFVSMHPASRAGLTTASAGFLNPFCVFEWVFEEQTLLIPFFSFHLSMSVALPAFCGVWAIWFLVASSAQLSQRMSMYTTRLPLAGLFLWVGIVLVGLLEGSSPVVEEKALEGRTMVLIAVYTLLIYGVDLTPFGFLAYYFSSSGFAWQIVVLLNALLIVFLAYLNWRWITHAYRNLPAELKGRTPLGFG